MLADRCLSRLLVVGLAAGAALIFRPGSACAESIFAPGATQVLVTFGGVVSEVRGDIPAIPLGTFVSGQFVYDLDVVDPSTGASPIIDLLISAGDVTFTETDNLGSAVHEFVGTFGFDAQALLQGRPDLGDLSGGVFFEVFAEFADFNFFLTGGTFDAAAFGGLSYLQFEDASTAIPEPPSLLMLSALLACVVAPRVAGKLPFARHNRSAARRAAASSGRVA
jgi:hypothetical protein